MDGFLTLMCWKVIQEGEHCTKFLLKLNRTFVRPPRAAVVDVPRGVLSNNGGTGFSCFMIKHLSYGRMQSWYRPKRKTWSTVTHMNVHACTQIYAKLCLRVYYLVFFACLSVSLTSLSIHEGYVWWFRSVSLFQFTHAQSTFK